MIHAAKFRDYVDREFIKELTMDLISIQSHPKSEDRESGVANYIYKLLLENGIDVVFQEVEKDRRNVIGRIRGQVEGKAVMLTGHMDTVEDYGYNNLFTPIIKENRIFGRGACDMKGPIAAMLGAAIAMKRGNITPYYDLILAFVVDEEFKSLGTESLIKSGIGAEAVILGEPTSLNICIGNRGLEWIDIIVKGRATHGGTVGNGVNAILKASKLIGEIESRLMPEIIKREHHVLGNGGINIGSISGGVQASSVPDRCIIKIDRRWLPGESTNQVYEEFRQVIEGIKKQDRDFEAEVLRDESGINEMEHGPFYLERDNELVVILRECIERYMGKVPEIKAFPGWTDASLISNFGGIPTVIFGPGDISIAHSERECVDIDELYDAALVYGGFALTYGR